MLPGLVVALAVMWPLWLPAVGTALVIERPPEPSDAVLLTYSGMIRAGIDETAGLVLAAHAPLVVVSNFPIDLADLELTARQRLTRDALVARGVPAAAIVALARLPTSEDEEAQAVAQLTRERGWRRLLVVALDYRMRRTLGTLAGALGPAVDLVPRPVRARDIELAHWWTHREGINAVLNEWPRLAYYWARRRL